LARTAPLISGAAVLMIAVFGAFTFTGINPIQQLGFGLAVAVALDATIVRLVIVPAAMRLLGRRNWWLPGGRRRHPAPLPPPPARPRGCPALNGLFLALLPLNFAFIGVLPGIFFRSDGRLNARWWATAAPFFVTSIFLLVAYFAGWDALVPRSWMPTLAVLAV